MTVPAERTRAIINTRKFLYSLLNPKETPRVPKDVRKMAARLLRHYPTDLDILLTVEGDREVFAKPEDKLA